MFLNPRDVGARLSSVSTSIAQAVDEGRHAAIEAVRAELARTLGPGCGADIGWISRTLPDPVPVTGRFADIYGACVNGTFPRPASADGLVALLIPGLFSKHYPTYMDDNERGLRAWSLPVQRAPVDTDATVAENAAVLATTLRACAPRTVIAVTHSKGGVDLTAAMALYPDVCRALRAIVLIQSPHGGSPVASDLVACPEIALATNVILNELSTMAPGAVADLSYANRREFISQHPFDAGDVPILCVASVSHAPLAVTALVADYIDLRYGYASDGLVCPEDAVLPGAYAVFLEGLDHASSTVVGIPNLASHYRPAHLTQAAVAVALEQ